MYPDILADGGDLGLDMITHSLRGVLDEGLLKKGALFKDLLHAPVHNLGPAQCISGV